MSARATRILGGLALLALATGLAAGFGYAPREAIQGNVQRIMYIHVPAVLTAYLAFGLVLVGSIGALATGRMGWDRLAGAAAELGVLFTAVTIVSGSIWGKPTWGTWWTWDARLTSTAVLFLVYAGYLLLRGAFSGNPKLAGMCTPLYDHRERLWTFLDVEGVEPTNNASERALRPAVIARKLSCGNKTQRGKTTWEILASLAATCHQRGQNLVELLRPNLLLPNPFPAR